MIYIIAEVGVNHNGSLKEAKRLIKAAKKTGVDAVKFQTFKASSLVVKETKKANYQRTQFNEESQYEMLKKLELTKDDFKELKAYTEDNNLDFAWPFNHGWIEI